MRPDQHEAKGGHEPSNVHSLMNMEDYGGLGPDVWGARYHGTHFPNEQRFVDHNINHFVFNDKDWVRKPDNPHFFAHPDVASQATLCWD
jgi:hypothetical protein